jgi:hypothetical protein
MEHVNMDGYDKDTLRLISEDVKENNLENIIITMINRCGLVRVEDLMIANKEIHSLKNLLSHKNVLISDLLNKIEGRGSNDYRRT